MKFEPSSTVTEGFASALKEMILVSCPILNKLISLSSPLLEVLIFLLIFLTSSFTFRHQGLSLVLFLFFSFLIFSYYFQLIKWTVSDL